ncbi:MAG: hypothetical protein ACYC9K_01020 [Sulfuricaulis sp.]
MKVWVKKQQRHRLLAHAFELRALARQHEESAKAHYEAAADCRRLAMCREREANVSKEIKQI